MLSLVDELSVVEVFGFIGWGFFEEIKWISEKRLDELGRFVWERRLFGCKVFNIVIEIMSFMF